MRIGSCSDMEWECNVANLALHAIAVSAVIDGEAYRRTVRIDGDGGVPEIHRERSGDVLMRAILPNWKDLLSVIQSTRRSFNLETRPASIGSGD